MSSNSSRSVALVTGASTETGRAVALCLAKVFDIVINDPPEALVPLEALKAQIENEGGKSVIVAGDPTKESFWASIRSTIDEHLGGRSLVSYTIQQRAPSTVILISLRLKQTSHFCLSDITIDDPDLGTKSSLVTAEAFKSLYRTHKSAAEQCSKRGPGATFVGVFTRIGNKSRYALNLVTADDERSAGTSLPGATGPLKFAIRGLTGAAATELSRRGINVKSYFTRGRQNFSLQFCALTLPQGAIKTDES
ncbi:hypothetical protein C0992_005910 [Termitomyces sp. T32_za158]|nr:hypothetical protein C0992_005910 [Termitomyces sp. T32_za158]